MEASHRAKLLLISLLMISVGVGAHDHVVLFKHGFFDGVPEKVLEYSRGLCKNFDEAIPVTSVKVHGLCVVLYEGSHCTGKSVKVPFDAPHVVFNTSSVRFC